MKKLNFTNILSMTALLFSAQSYAGEASLTWNDPAQYTDIKPGIATQKATLSSIQKAFTETFDASATQLPSGYVFNAEITNVDLAGRVDPPQVMNPNLMNTRVLTANYFPAITLNYTLSNAKGEVIQHANDVVVKDMDYLSGTNAASKMTPYYYETRMIKNWFADTIIPAAK